MAMREGGWGDEEQLVQHLSEFGLSRSEARLYLAASGRPPLRVAELAELAEIPRPKAYDGLRQLVDKGLVSELPGRVARFEAVDPMLVVQHLRQQSLADQADRVEDTSRLVADLFARYYDAPHGDDPFDYVELIRNSEAAWARRDAITAGAEKEVVQARKLPPPGVAPRAGDELGVREGVRYRCLHERGFLAHARFRARLAERERRGEEIRFVPEVAVSMCVVDRRKCLLSLNRTGVVSGQGSWLVLEHPALASMLTDAFEVAWELAEPAQP
jgi:Sugar-specific transcriptional regulator TrmB